MTTIRVSERGRDSSGRFRVRVSFGDNGEYDTEIVEPADETVEGNLAWYFEQHLKYPFLDTDREHLAVREITDYGLTLFSQVFGGEANYDYRKLRDRSFDGCQLAISGSTALHSLHWEALRDPDMDVPLVLRLPITRRVDALPSRFELPDRQPSLNILLVTARPHGPGDVGYRTISRPLLAALRIADLPVRVDLVRPGTWDALQAHLRRTTEQNGSGWYQIIHFDLHGTFSEYAPLVAGIKAERLTFAHRPLESFEGRRGFLVFETAQEGTAEPVPAEAVASLLAEHRVPMAVLNACQSAMQSASEAGLAQRLAEAGVPVAVGMAYSVTVSAAERAMPILYGRLAEGADPVSAVHAARRELYEHRGRQAYFNQQIDLDDWMLPVVFGQRRFHIRLRNMTDHEQARFNTREAITGDEPFTEYGFVGRDLDVQAIERRLLTKQDSNELLMQGMAGAGKSTLLAHLAWWWQRTGLVEHVFRFSYEDQAWTCNQIIRDIRSKLFSSVEQAQADRMPDAAQLEQIARRLRASRHLLTFDNAESITGVPAAIPHTLNASEQHKLKVLLSRLRGGRTLVLLASREPETWLTAGSDGPCIYPLPGLDPQASSMLVDRILRRHGATDYLRDTLERTALDNLVTALGGYPLPLTTVLPILATTPPSAVLAELQTGGSDADPAGLIHRAIEYSHGKLDPALQNSLLLLAPFTSVVGIGSVLDRYRDLLLDEKVVKDLGPINLHAALSQAVKVGLASPHPQLTNVLQLQPVLPYFLRSCLHGKPSLETAVSQAHYQLYSELGADLRSLLFSDSEPERLVAGQAITLAEYANLSEAMAYGLRTGQPIAPLIEPLNEVLHQAGHHHARRQILDEAIAGYPDHPTQPQQEELAALHNYAGDTALDQHRYSHARDNYETALRLLQASEKRLTQAYSYYQLGRVGQAQRRFDEAQASYRQALDIYIELGDEHSAGRTYGQLGWLAQDQRQFDEARANYRKALSIKLKAGDERGAAMTYHQLGWVAQMQRRFDEAEANYRRALHIKLKLGGPIDAAGTYHEIGVLHQEQERYADSEISYRQALDIYLEFNDQHSAAKLYHQIGTLAQEQHRYDEAEANYRRAREIFREFGDRHSMAGTYHQLGSLAGEQRRFDEAQAYARKALDIYLEAGDRYSAAHAHRSLGIDAQELQQFIEAEASFRKALDIYVEFGDQRSATGTASRLGVVLAQLGRHDEAAHQLIYATATRRLEFGAWSLEDLQLLHSERALIDPDMFSALVEANVPPDLAEELIAGVDEAEDLLNAVNTKAVLREWLDQSPNWAASAAYLADHVQELFDPLTIGFLDGACELQPTERSLWLHLGLLHLADQAAEGYASAETGDPDPFQKAASLLERSHLDLALAWSCMARAADPGSGALLMAQIQLRRGRLDRASDALAVAADVIESDRLTEVLSTYDDLLTRQPDQPWRHAEHADALARANQTADAIVAWNRAVSLAPDNPSLHFNLGNLLFSLSKFEEAQTELLTVITLRPDDILGPAVLLAAIAWPTDTEQAKDHLLAALSSPGGRLPPFVRAFYRAIALTGLGRTDEALTELEAVTSTRSERKNWLDGDDKALLERFRESPPPGLDALKSFLDSTSDES